MTEHENLSLPSNFRDAGATVGLAPNVLLRSAEPTYNTRSLGGAQTIITLSRSAPDVSSITTPLVHVMVPATKGVECYDTSQQEVRRWLQKVLSAICCAIPPVLVHCKAGRDRTGVVVAVCLLALGVDEGRVREDYLISLKPEVELFELMIGGIRKSGGVRKYLRGKVDLDRLCAMFEGE